MTPRTPRRTGRNAEAGFTLLELLVALSVLGFLVLGLAQGVRFGLTAWDAQARLAGAHADLDVVDRALRRMVAQIVPTDEADVPAIRGTADGFECVTELPAAATLPSRRVVAALGVDRSRRLVLRWVPHLHARRLGPPPAPQETELLRGVERLDLAYWSAADGGVWLPVWNRTEAPDLVRIRFVFPRGDRRHWPDIIAAPMRERFED
jgi:general secretion pathway protein J